MHNFPFNHKILGLPHFTLVRQPLFDNVIHLFHNGIFSVGGVDDTVADRYGCIAVGYEKHRFIGHGFYIAENESFGGLVKRRGGFVKQKHGSIVEQGACDRYTLYLSLGKSCSALGKHGVKTVG